MDTRDRQAWQRADALLDELLDLGDADRHSRLEALRDRPEVHGRVEALLRAAGVEGGLLDRPAPDLAPVQEDGAVVSAIGRVVGAWVLEEELGRGGMAAVYRARRQGAGFEQTAALKLLTIGMLHADGARRFRREQQILASLQHPHIASLIDGGVTEDGTPYLVMEHVRGQTIERYCDEHSLDLDARIDLLRQACAAVAYAHRNLVVHRDIKPSNVMVDGRGAVRLLDFGIAKLVEEEAERQTSTRVLTPGYAAPEQHRGGRVTTATDVFGLGAVLYRLLTGASPFGEPAEGGRLEVDRAPLAALDGDLRNIVSQALRPEPERRYADAAALADDLERWLAARPVAATPDSRAYRLRKLLRRRRAAVAAGALALAGLLTGLGVALWQAQEAREQARIAALEAERVAAVGTFLAGLFESSDPTRAQGEDLRASEILRRGATQLELELGDQPEVRAELLLIIGGIQRQLGLYDDAATALPEAERGLREVEDGARWTRAVVERSRLEMDLGDYVAAERRLRGHLGAILGRDAAAEHRRVIVEERLAEALLFASRLDDAERTARRGLERLDRHGIDDPLLRINLLRNRGAALELSGDLEQAAGLLRRAVALERVRQQPPGVDLATILTDLGITSGKAGDLDASEEALREALGIYRLLLGEDHAVYGSGLQNLGLCLFFQDRLDEAAALLEEAREVKVLALGDEHPSTGTTTYNLARLQHQLGRFEEAESNFLEARRIFAATLPPEHHSRGDLLSLYGALLLDVGRAGEAEAVLNEALAVLRENLSEEHVAVATARLRLARALTALGALEAAGALLEGALEVVVAARGEGDALAQEGRLAVAGWHFRRGERERAEALVERARSHLRADRPRDRRLLDGLAAIEPAARPRNE